MKIQSISNNISFENNAKLKNMNINVKQLQKYLQRASLVVGADVLILNGSSMQGEVAPPLGFEKVALPWYKRFLNTILGQPTYKYERVEEVTPLNPLPKPIYDVDVVTKILNELKQAGHISFERNSLEAVNFALFQDDLIKSNMIAQPILGIDELFDFNKISSIADLVISDDLSEYKVHILERLSDIVEYLMDV